ncbi:hypothetical protein KA005_85740 [bacterium]|nr:hypothetical protein [bacterium]
MQNLVLLDIDTYAYVDADQQDRAEERKDIFSWTECYLKIRNKQPLYQNSDISEEKQTSLLTHLAEYFARVLYSKDLQKASENFEAVRNYWETFYRFVFTEEEKSISTISDVIDIEFEPPERRRITWEQAHMLAFTSLIDAEERRHHFAEEEAKRTAVWEELD